MGKKISPGRFVLTKKKERNYLWSTVRSVNNCRKCKATYFLFFPFNYLEPDRTFHSLRALKSSDRQKSLNFRNVNRLISTLYVSELFDREGQHFYAHLSRYYCHKPVNPKIDSQRRGVERNQKMEHEIGFKIREYRSSDYQQIFDLVYEAGLEPWTSAYTNTISGAQPLCLCVRAFLLAAFLQLEFPLSFLGPLFYEALLIAFIYGVVFWYPTW